MIYVDTNKEPITYEALLVVQLRADGEPFLPRLESFKCCIATEALIPFIPIFLSPQTVKIDVEFPKRSPAVAVASIIIMFPKLCPNLESIAINHPFKDSAIIDAASEMLLACNRDSLKILNVKCPLTEEAREVVYQLPKLSDLWTVIKGHTLLPPVALPNLTKILVRFDHLDWLQGLRGAALEKLESAIFQYDESKQIGDFLGELERVSLMASAQNTLSEFIFHTPGSWNPNYSFLLSFKQLRRLEIVGACDGGCSSRVDDDVIKALAQAMPKLEILRLGSAPCGAPAGATVHGLIALASRCLHLSELRIHFQGNSLADAVTSVTARPLFYGEPVAPREECALTVLEVGSIPLPLQSAEGVTVLLLQIFPRITKVDTMTPEWRIVAQGIWNFRKIATFVRRTGKASMILNDLVGRY